MHESVIPDHRSGSPLSHLNKLAEVDPRYQSYNIEMVEVTGGRFWAPYGAPAGEMFQYRAPIDLADPKLRMLASHLSPAYVRISGTWANSTYVAADGEMPSKPPTGFGQVLTKAQWKGVVDFSKAVDARIVTSFAASAGTRDKDGRWTSTQAERLLSLTTSAGGKIHAAEFINEPALTGPGGLPPTYDSSAYALDFSTFANWARQNAPQMLLIGPGNLGEETVDPVVAAKLMAPNGTITTKLLLEKTAEHLDAVSWHFYGGVSPRCRSGNGLDSREAALSSAWLDRTLIEYDAMAKYRNDLAAGKPLWLTETAQAACGGSPWAAGFLDSFRYLNQLGALAQRGVKVVMHNTLSASDYGLIDPETLAPRPNYWAALLWRKTMGRVVLQPPQNGQSGLRIFTHCLPEMNGGVGLMALNPGDAPLSVNVGGPGKVWIMQADAIDIGPVKINGRQPVVQSDGAIDALPPADFEGELILPAQSIAFAAVDQAANSHCQK